MATQGSALPRPSTLLGVEDPGRSFWELIQKELTPYPGRAWVVARMTIAATIMMLLVMTFRIPGGFLGAVFTLFLTRENPMATFKAGLRTVLAFLTATAYTILTAAMFVDNPMTHFLWVAFSLFISFYLIRVMQDYGTAVAFGFMISGALPLWDQHALNVNQRLENTLWTTLAVALGVLVTIVVEFVFRRAHPMTDITEGIDARLKTVETILRAAAVDQPAQVEAEKRLQLYTSVGMSRLRRLILRSEYNVHFKSQATAAVSLVGRLIDITVSFEQTVKERKGQISQPDRQRCVQLADRIKSLSNSLTLRQLPDDIKIPSESDDASSLNFLLEMERTVAFIPKAFMSSEPTDVYVPTPLDLVPRERIFVSDALTNTAYLQFAIRGTLAAMACYMVYTGIDWTGLSTSLATCFITALTTIGSSRQKQILRLGGAILGGIIFGMGAQIFILPYLDTIFGFTLLFALVTAVSAWISTSSSRLSYLGVQVALAFYLINLQEFTIQVSLAVARDRIFGVLLGLFSMWLLFDRLWVRSALEEMQSLFARNLELSAEFAEQLIRTDMMKTIYRIRQLRDEINAGFAAEASQADAILFEFGRDREKKLRIRNDFRRWEPSLRTLLQLQITLSQYRVRLSQIPEAVARAGMVFEKAIAAVMRAMAADVKGWSSKSVPDIQAAADKLKQAIVEYHRSNGTPMTSEGADIIEVTQSMASVLTPLYRDVHSESHAA